MTHTSPAKTIVIAHRGASGYLPEHTLAAKALAHGMGADYLEQDIVLTSDGVPIVLHDIYLEPTTDVAQQFPGRQRPDGRYYAIDFSLAEIRRLRVHERSEPNARGEEQAVFQTRFPLGCGWEGVPTLAEEIDLIDGLNVSRSRRTGLYIELKAPAWHRRQGLDIVNALMRVLTEKDYATRKDQVFLQCFDDATLRYLRHTVRTPLPLIQLIADNSWGEDSEVDYDFLRTAEGLDAVAGYADGIGPWLMHIYQGRNPAGQPVVNNLIDMARARRLLVHPYTFRADQLPAGIASFKELLDLFIADLQVDGLFTDFPDLAREYLALR